jgi:hypothetical protein
MFQEFLWKMCVRAVAVCVVALIGACGPTSGIRGGSASRGDSTLFASGEAKAVDANQPKLPTTPSKGSGGLGESPGLNRPGKILPNDLEESEFATGLLLFTCDHDPPELTLPRNLISTHCEQTAVATAFRNDEGDAYEVSMPITWESNDPAIQWSYVPGSTNHRIAYAASSLDLFETYTEKEPRSLLRVCAKNSCPSGQSGCQPQVCREFLAVSVVNLEGEWRITGAGLSPAGLPVTISQDGRRLDIREVGFTKSAFGQVFADQVSWRANDLVFIGAIDPSRELMFGLAYHEQNLGPAFDWLAERLPSQEH